MAKFLSGLITGALVLASHSAEACRGNTLVPPHGQSANYQVLLVEVTGMRLRDYEWYRAASLGIAPWPKAPGGVPVVYPTSSTPNFTINVIIRHATLGTSSAVREFELGGCGVLVPGLKESGLLFVAPGGKVGAVWESQQPQYSLWLHELGLGAADEP